MANTPEQVETVKRPGAVDPANIFGDPKAADTDKSHGVQKVYQDIVRQRGPQVPVQQKVTQDTPPQPGENLDENAANAPRDAGSAFRQVTREFPRKVESKN